MSRFFVYLALGLALTGGAAPLTAALQWEQTRIAVKAAPFDEEAVGVFTFTNSGSAPITILEASADCGCTVPTLAKKTYAPGEKGEVRAVFTFGGREGVNNKMITVTTDEPGNPNYTLELQADVPRLFEVRPTILVWRKGEALTPKTATIHLLHPELVWPVAVESRDQRFRAELTAVPSDPARHTITVTPPEGAGDNVVNVLVTMNAPAEKPRVALLYVRVF